MLINILWSQYNMLLSHYRVIVNTLGLKPYSNGGIFMSSLSHEVRTSINGIAETICTRLEPRSFLLDNNIEPRRN